MSIMSVINNITQHVMLFYYKFMRPLTFTNIYNVQIYPGERHSLRHPDSNEHYLTSLLSFLKKNL